jgi:hypothetical protein
MADRDTITIPLELPPDEAAALAQLVKRIDYNDCRKLADKHVRYDGRCESDVMWSAVCMLQRELAEAGFAPRGDGRNQGRHARHRPRPTIGITSVA